MKLSENIIKFFSRQEYVLIHTLDEEGRIHTAAKGIVGIEESGKLFIIDLFLLKTYENLKANPTVSVTAINAVEYKGYCLQGHAMIVPREEIQSHIMKDWEDRIIQRITERLRRNVQKGMISKQHYEAQLPHHPKYLIVIDVERIVDLRPPHQRHDD